MIIEFCDNFETVSLKTNNKAVIKFVKSRIKQGIEIDTFFPDCEA